MCEPATIAAITTGVAGSAGAGTAAALTTAQMVSLGLSAAGVGLGAYSAYQQSSTAKKVAERNAAVSEIQAQDAERRGELEAQAAQRKGAALASTQRSMFAARGLDLSSGTPGDILDQTSFFTSMDAQTVRDNAAKEAWARRSQGANFSAEAAAQRPWLSTGSTLLSGAGAVADRWARFSTPDPYRRAP